MYHKVVWQQMQGVIGFLITSLLQIYLENFPLKNFKNDIRFDRIMAMNLWPHFFRPFCTPLQYTATALQQTGVGFCCRRTASIEHAADRAEAAEVDHYFTSPMKTFCSNLLTHTGIQPDDCL